MAEPPPGMADVSLQLQNQVWFPSLLIDKLLKLPFWDKYRGGVMVTELRPPLQHSIQIFTQVSEMLNACVDPCRPYVSDLLSIMFGSLHKPVGVTVRPAGDRFSINSFPSEWWPHLSLEEEEIHRL